MDRLIRSVLCFILVLLVTIGTYNPEFIQASVVDGDTQLGDVSGSDLGEEDVFEAGEISEVELYRMIQDIDQETEILEEELVKLQDKVEATKQDILDKEKEIEDNEAEYERELDKFGERLRVYHKEYSLAPGMYILKQFDLILQSKSVAEFMGKAEMLKKLVKHDREVLRELQVLKSKLDRSKNELLRHRSFLARAEVEMKDKLSELEALRSDKLAELETRLSELDLKAEGQVNEKMYGLLDLDKLYTGGNMINPFEDEGVYRISSPYGGRIHPITGVHKMHTGVDFAAPLGTKVRAIGDGTVVWSGSYGGYGRTIILDHGNGILSLYAHNSLLWVEVGDVVSKGDVICQVGSTGFSTGPHLHLEVRVDGKPINPFEWVGSDMGERLELKNIMESGESINEAKLEESKEQ